MMPFFDCALGTKEIFTFYLLLSCFPQSCFPLHYRMRYGIFPIYLPILTLPVQIQVIIKSHSCHFMSPRKPKVRRNHGACHGGQHFSNGTQEPAFPKMNHSYKQRRRWCKSSPTAVCCKPLHMAEPWRKGLGTANWKMSWLGGSTFSAPLKWLSLASVQRLLLVTIIHNFFSSSYNQLRTQ